MDISEAHHLSEMRIVLMGYKLAGKSSTGNRILGREEFDLKRSAQCVRRHGDVDTHITVIEAPGWWKNYTVEESPEILKQEIVFSVSQCPPGPHALLLIIPVDTKVRDYVRKSVEAHVSLLGERVWSHTIVVFTHGDSLSDISIEQHIESEGQELQRLLDKCGNRYHVLNNHSRSDGTQIKELLEKIEETVVQNNSRHFEIDRKILQEMKERRRAEEERAEERMKRMKKWRENIRSQISEAHHLSELRIVLMGYKLAGKSSTGNSILGRDEFDLKRSAQCVKRHGDTHITVIEAPGWWKNYTVEESPELLKQEIVFSVSQCPPGPHALLLIIDVDTKVTDYMRESVEAHVSLLCERVWSHTIVVFTCGDSLLDTSIEQHIESEGQELQRLLDKCGNRYHVLNNHNRSDSTQIKELLEKIEETVVQNKGCHFEIDRKILQKLEERIKAEEERAEERMKRMKKQRDEIRSQMSNSQCLSELRIVLIGNKASGKSSTGNSILGREEFDLKSSAQCVKRHGDVGDTHITVIEAPGWWKNYTVEKSPELLKQEIVFSVSQCPPGPHALLLIIRVDTKVRDYVRESVEAHVSLLGERVWSHTIVVFTCGDSLSDTSIEQHIESEGQELQRLLDKCGNRYHVLNNHNRSDGTQIKELLEKIEETVAQNNSRHFETEIKTMKQQENDKSLKVSGNERMDTSVYSSSRSRDSGVQRKCVSMELPPSLLSGAEQSDTSFYSSSRSRDSGVQNKSVSMELPPSLLSGAEQSDTSFYSSSRSRDSGVQNKSVSMELPPTLLSGAEQLDTFIYSSSRSRDSGIQRKCGSMELLESGNKHSDTQSLGSSAYSSLRSLSGEDGGSAFSVSHSSLSSGYVSLWSIPESVEQADTAMLDKLEISNVRSQMRERFSSFSFSHSSLSSGFVSLQSIPESAEQSKTRTKVFSKTMGKHDKHEEETDNT